MDSPKGKNVKLRCYMTECIHHEDFDKCNLEEIYLDYGIATEDPCCMKFQKKNEKSVEEQVYG